MVRSKTQEIKGKIRLHKGIIILIIFAFLILTYKLGDIPVHLNQDEMEFALNGDSISKNLNDQNGRFLPFYFWHLDNFWATPVIVYLTAITQIFFNLSVFSIRLTSVFVGLFCVFMTYAISHEIFEDKKYALISALMLLMTPLFFLHSRLLLDNLYPVPFVLIWLYYLIKYENTKSNKYLIISGLSLGVGFHSYHAAKVMMPAYFLLTSVYLFFNKMLHRRSFISITFGFLLPIIIFIPWLNKYPNTLLNQVNYAAGIDQSIDVDRGLLGVFNTSRLQTFTKSYVSYFGGKVLFTEGDYSQIHSTRRTGAFLFSFSTLMFVGIVAVLYRKDKFSKLILIGFLLYPIAPSLVNEPQRISRGLVVIPFFILISTYGSYFLLNSKEKALKGLFVLIFAISSFQYLFFLKDYFNYYPIRSYSWFGGNVGGAVEQIILQANEREVQKIYLDDQVLFIPRYFEFYQRKHDYEFGHMTNYFDPRVQDFTEFEEGSIVLVKGDHINTDSVRVDDHFNEVFKIMEPDGTVSFYVFYKSI